MAFSSWQSIKSPFYQPSLKFMVRPPNNPSGDTDVCQWISLESLEGMLTMSLEDFMCQTFDNLFSIPDYECYISKPIFIHWPSSVPVSLKYIQRFMWWECCLHNYCTISFNLDVTHHTPFFLTLNNKFNSFLNFLNLWDFLKVKNSVWIE